MTSVLSLDAASLRIGSRPVVDDVTLELNAGCLTALVGPNGAGKSSLIGLASGWRRPTSGAVLCDGMPIASWPQWRLAAKRVVMPQSGGTGFAFTVEDTVRIGCDGIGRGLDAAARDRLVMEALEQANIGHLSTRVMSTLSGGEQQRARFARALCQLLAGSTIEQRQIAILDEPVAGLDLKHQIFLLDVARDLARKGTAVLVVLHELTLARAYADRVAVMAEGRLVADGPPDTVLTAACVRDVFGLSAAASRLVLPWLDVG